jgi:sec-independent protein translocase protein TatC
MPDKKLSLIEHLQELRSRLIKSIIFIIVCSIFLYNYIDRILFILSRPVGRLVFISPTEALITNIKIAFLGGIFLSSPFVIYQIWRFVGTGLNPRERRYTLLFGPFSFLFFILGCIFGYFVIVPVGMKFLLSFASDALVPMITISRYISFIGTLTLTFGIVFQLPLLSLFLTKIGIVSPAFLSNKRKHAIVFIFILAATLTPPDVITQCLMAVPLLVLYEISIIFSKIIYRPI